MFIFSERLQEFKWSFQDETNDNIKSYKKRGLHPLFRNIFLQKPQEGGQIDPTAFLGLR